MMKSMKSVKKEMTCCSDSTCFLSASKSKRYRKVFISGLMIVYNIKLVEKLYKYKKYQGSILQKEGFPELIYVG